MDTAFIALIDYNITDGDSSGIRTHIIGLRGRPPKPFRGWSHTIADGNRESHFNGAALSYLRANINKIAILKRCHK